MNAQRNAGAGKGNESGNKSGSSSIVEIVDEEKGTFIIKDWSDYPDDYVPVPDQNKGGHFLKEMSIILLEIQQIYSIET